jgi:hypothetical protein
VFDANPQFTIVQPGADRIGALDGFSVYVRPEGEILTLPESESIGKVFRHFEIQHHGMIRFLAKIADFQLMKMVAHCFLSNFTDI